MRTKIASIAAVGFVALFSLTVSATPQGDQTTIHRFGNVRGMEVKNSQGEALGDIEDVVVDLKTCKIEYMAMAHGEFLGFGGKLFAIAPTALKLSTDGKSLLLNHSRKEFLAAQGFDANKWPTQADARWGKAAAKHAENGKGMYRLSRLQGIQVRNSQGQDLGRIYDFALDLNHERVVYAAVSTDTTLGFGGKLIAVPCQAFTLRSQELDPAHKEFILNVSKQSFDGAPAFKNSQWPTEPDSRFLKK
jgi:sporulation protein YlmC with PRC-barrel domain